MGAVTASKIYSEGGEVDYSLRVGETTRELMHVLHLETFGAELCFHLVWGVGGEESPNNNLDASGVRKLVRVELKILFFEDIG